MKPERTERYFLVNPAYREAAEDWVLCDDCLAGERIIKQRGEIYLPRTEGQMADPRFGSKRYEAYKFRANYFNYFASAVHSMLGLMHREPPELTELPERLGGMQNHFSVTGTALADFLKEVNFHQLVYGRCGLLLDVPEWDDSPVALPACALFPACRILDWKTDRDSGYGSPEFVLLDESSDEFDPVSKTRRFNQKVRLCTLDPSGDYYTVVLTPAEYLSYDFMQYPDESAYPEIRGRRLDAVPFVFVNSADTRENIQVPPLISLAQICLAIYRNEADYRHALYMQAQSTLFLKGFPLDDPPMTGAGNYIHTESSDGDGKFLEVSGSGLSEMRTALNDLHQTAWKMGIALTENGTESGTALKTRLSVQTALLRTVAGTAGNAILQILRTAAEWCGCDPDSVRFSPNMDFSDDSVSAAEVAQLWSAKSAGLPLSNRSIHDWLRKNDYTDLSFEEEKDLE